MDLFVCFFLHLCFISWQCGSHRYLSQSCSLPQCIATPGRKEEESLSSDSGGLTSFCLQNSISLLKMCFQSHSGELSDAKYFTKCFHWFASCFLFLFYTFQGNPLIEPNLPPCAKP